jgi:hypothetical protein
MATAALPRTGQARGVFLGIVVVVVLGIVVVVVDVVVVVVDCGTVVVVLLGVVVVEVLVEVVVVVDVVVVVGNVVTHPPGNVVVGARAGLSSADVAADVVTMNNTAHTMVRSGPRRSQWVTRRVTP